MTNTALKENEFEHNDNVYRLIKFVAPKTLIVWRIDNIVSGEHTETCMTLNVESVDIKTLKSINVWEKMEDKMKDDIENGVIVQEQIQEKIEGSKTAEVKVKRGDKYKGIPTEYICTGCQAHNSISSAIVGKRIEKKGITVEEFTKTYKCQKCVPTRGRPKGSKKHANIPTEYTCTGCGKVDQLNSFVVNKRVEKRGGTIEDYVKTYKCQICVPTRGRPKKISV